MISDFLFGTRIGRVTTIFGLLAFAAYINYSFYFLRAGDGFFAQVFHAMIHPIIIGLVICSNAFLVFLLYKVIRMV